MSKYWIVQPKQCISSIFIDVLQNGKRILQDCNKSIGCYVFFVNTVQTRSSCYNLCKSARKSSKGVNRYTNVPREANKSDGSTFPVPPKPAKVPQHTAPHKQTRGPEGSPENHYSAYVRPLGPQKASTGSLEGRRCCSTIP